jgi:DNA-binding GntR family transcriptional regulator
VKTYVVREDILMIDGSNPKMSTAAMVVEHIRRRITLGFLSPGDRLVEVDIASNLSVSRGPIREAFLKLEGEGLVTIVPYRGAIVTKLEPTESQQLQRFRLQLEEMAVMEIAALPKIVGLQRMRSQDVLLRKHGRSGKVAAAVHAYQEFHRLLIAATQNAYLERAYAEISGRVRLQIMEIFQYHADHGGLTLDPIADEHEALLECLVRRDAVAARRLMRAYISSSFKRAPVRLEGR